jgi:hypothetical protein
MDHLAFIPVFWANCSITILLVFASISGAVGGATNGEVADADEVPGADAFVNAF